MSNQRKEYDNPKDAITDLTTLGAAAIINKGLTVWLVSHQFDELVPEIEHVLCLKYLIRHVFYY